MVHVVFFALMVLVLASDRIHVVKAQIVKVGHVVKIIVVDLVRDVVMMVLALRLVFNVDGRYSRLLLPAPM
jgi:hypothetical protein